MSEIEARSGETDVQASGSVIVSRAMKKSKEGCCDPNSAAESSRERTSEEAERSNSSCQVIIVLTESCLRCQDCRCTDDVAADFLE